MKNVIILFCLLFVFSCRHKDFVDYDLKSPCVSSGNGPCDVRVSPLLNKQYLS